MMEERGLGTKATRADIIQKLFDRGYVYGNPPIPTETGIALYEAFKNYVPAMATPEMTAQLEAEMDRIAAGEMTKGEVVGESRDLLHKTWTEIDESQEDLAKVVWKGMDEDRILGPCKVCEEAGRKKEDGSPHMLRIIRAKKSGKRFVGCSGWTLDDPESCDQTFPLPQRGDVFKLEERCSICGETPRLKVQPFRGRPWNLCLNDDCESMQEMKKRRAEREAAKAAKAAMDEEAAGQRRRGRDTREDEKSESQSVQSGHRHARAQTRQSRDQSLRYGRVHLARGRRRLGQEHPGAAAGRGARPRDAADPRAGRDRRRRADPRAARRPGLELDPFAELLLFSAARADLVSRVIRPALEAGRVVVADRFADSSVAYQGGARGLGTSEVLSLTDTVIDGLWPDLTLLLRVDPEVGLGRAEGEDRFEAEGLELQRAVAEAYEEIAIIASDRVVVIDADGSVEEVHERVIDGRRSPSRMSPTCRISFGAGDGPRPHAMSDSVARQRDRAPAAGAGGARRGARLGPLARLPLPRPARVRQARRGPRLRGGDPRRRRRGRRRRPPPRPARPLAAPRPRLAGAARRPAPGRGGPRAGDPRRLLPPLRGRASGSSSSRPPRRCATRARTRC